MFWTNVYTLSPHIEALLNKEDVTLHELMDQEEIVPECKSQNKKLVEYLTRPEVMEELVTLITKEPENDIEEKWRYKYPNVACELLTCNVPTLNEKLAGSDALLMKLYSFIDTDKPLNPLLASFFSKIIGVLLIRKGDQVLEFLKSRQMCVDRLLQHLETSAIMDLVLKLVTKVEGSDMRQNILNWLDTQQLVQQLIKLLSPTSGSARHTNAAQLLCDIIKSAREYTMTCTERVEHDPILNTLESEETVSLLLNTILSGEQTESSIVGGIQVLLVLLGQDTNSNINEQEMQGNNSGDEITDNVERSKNIVGYKIVQNATLPYLEKLQNLLLNPPPKKAVKTTAGLLEVPLGNTRLHIAKLLTALLSIANIKVFEKLAHLGTFQTLLDLFSTYCWNNFLHTQVEQCLGFVINGDWQENNNSVYTHIFIQCKLIDRVLEAWDGNDNKQNKKNGIRQGYMGHLITIANHIMKKSEKNQEFNEYLKNNLDAECLQKWETLVNTQLYKIDMAQEVQLFSVPTRYMASSEDSTEDYNSYSQDAYVQQAYANYQGQQMTPPYIENYGFHDDGFNDSNDALQPSNSVDQLNTMPSIMSEEDLVKQEESFNKICQQKQKAGLEEGGIEWGDDGELTFQTVIDKRDWLFKQQQHDSISSDEDEDEDNKDLHMEIDSSNPWMPSGDQLSNNTVLPEVNPWDSTISPSDESAGWANFDNFDSTLNITGPIQFNMIDTSEEHEVRMVPETTTDISDDKTSVEVFKNINDVAPNNNTEKNVAPSVATNSDRNSRENTSENSGTTTTSLSSVEKKMTTDRESEKLEDESRALTTL
ncbi:hypothetical protein PV328_001516 [Microctonus aethiopoides]|uniref:Serine/threonine-protein phosphatase 6 regulatory subunit 3 n=1 Tax=Microctonus aethiopoides TaxID=144406 RepID=A0AA39FX44_9HYME|nr:hypothetical protein PV328_001516 [Microctonus aethiopoides]